MGTRARNNTKWFTNVFPRLSEIRDWCMDGKTNEEMCVLLGISPDSWYTYWTVKSSRKKYNPLTRLYGILLLLTQKGDTIAERVITSSVPDFRTIEQTYAKNY